MKQLTDQAAHLAAGLIALVPLALFPSIATGAWAGFVIGMVRELTEEGSKLRLVHFARIARSHGSRIDLAFWTLGGALAGSL